MRINQRRLPALRLKQLCLAISAILAPCAALAAPTGGNVTSGAANIVQTGKVTNVNQSSNAATINWWTFSTAAGETVNFNQPNVSSITLNRVIGNEMSVLNGALHATGNVILLNSAGVLIGKGGSVQTGGGFVASTLGLSDADFNAGKYTFASSGGSTGSVVNQGTITAGTGGYVALLGNVVSNQGTITATKGTVALASGDKISLNFNGDSLVSVTVDQGTLNSLVENKQAIYADGGQVIMTAMAADNLLNAQVNNTGVIQAQTIGDLKGSIALNAHGGTTHVDGTLDASAPNGGDGGFIETSGDKVNVADGAIVTTYAPAGKTGTWLIDPTDFTIFAGTGGSTTGSGIGADTLVNGINGQGGLAQTSITIATAAGGTGNGDINVNAPVTWDSGSVLTLNAANNININAAITATNTANGSAGLVLNYGGYNQPQNSTTVAANTNYNINAGGSVTLNGSNATLAINGDSYTLIHGMADFALIDAAPHTTGTGFYALAEEIPALGWDTHGQAVVPLLAGTLAGLGHSISNLTINDTAGNGTVALIGKAQADTVNAPGTNPVIRDLKLTNVNISSTGSAVAGLLANGLTTTSISNVSVLGGTVTGVQAVGGLVGSISSVSIKNATTDVAVSGRGSIGGLVGQASTLAGGPVASIDNSFAAGPVTVVPSSFSSSNIGGLVGIGTGLIISNSGASGAVTASNSVAVGGLVGNLVTSTTAGSPVASISNSTASGAVIATCSNTNICGSSAPINVGGLAGFSSGNISGSRATGNVTVTAIGTFPVSDVGGLVGNMATVGSTTHVGGQITNSSASGNVTGVGLVQNVGGLVGLNTQGNISGSSASGNVTGYNTLGGLVGSNSGSATFTSGSTISNSSASGNVTWNGAGTAPITGTTLGGLVGNNSRGHIVNSSASGAVSGANTLGGLVGTNSSGTIDNSSASGNVTGSNVNANNGVAMVGGLVGNNTTNQAAGSPLGTITNSTASGNVRGIGPAVGGLVGTNGGNFLSPTFGTILNVPAGAIVNSTATGSVSGPGTGGGRLVGVGSGAVTNSSYHDVKAEAQVATVSQLAGDIVNTAQQTLTPPVTNAPNGGTTPPPVDGQIVFSDNGNFSADVQGISVESVKPNANGNDDSNRGPGK